VVVRSGQAGFGVGSKELLVITTTGRIVLRGLQSYLATVEPLFPLDVHKRGPNYPTTKEALTSIKRIDGLYDLLVSCSRPRFGGTLYQPPPIPSNPPGEFDHIPAAQAEALLSFPTVRGGAAEWTPERTGEVEALTGITLAFHNGLLARGPHGLLRVLAFDLDAQWV
jgi:hypothetical protein